MAVSELRLVGGLPCLDFVNSLDWRTSDDPIEYLHSFDDLLQWSVLTGVLTSAQSRSLAGAGNAAARSAALRRAIAFREAAYRVLEAARSRHSPEPRDSRLLNETIEQARARQSLSYAKDRFVWAFVEPRQLDLPLWSVALSLETLLTSEDLDLVRECGGPGCGWLFLDSTKNHSRRWCSMDGCGNRAKARRFYNRYYR